MKFLLNHDIKPKVGIPNLIGGRVWVGCQIMIGH